MRIERHNEARRVSERERANQSKPKLRDVPECQRLTELENRSRRESNPHLRFRKPPFYPLNYGNKTVEIKYLCKIDIFGKSPVATYCQISDTESMETPFSAIRTKRQRSHALRIVREGLNGKYRFKIAGYYVDGKRIRKYFETRKAAETF